VSIDKHRDIFFYFTLIGQRKNMREKENEKMQLKTFLFVLLLSASVAADFGKYSQ